MLRNQSTDTLVLRWAGIVTELRPGQECRYRDPLVEVRMRQKFYPQLAYEPNPPEVVETVAVVRVGPVPATMPTPAVPVPDESADPVPEAPPKPPRGRPKKGT